MQKFKVQRRTSTRGSAILEASFIFLVFFCLLIGTFDFGQFLFIHQALVERARSATRWATVTYSLATDTPTIDQIKYKVVFDQTTDPGTPGYFNLTTSMVQVTRSTDTVCFQSGANPSLYKRLIITIHDYPYQILSPYIAGTYNGPNISIGSPIFQDFSTASTTCP